MTVAKFNDVQIYPSAELMSYMEKQAELFEKARPEMIRQFWIQVLIVRLFLYLG